MKKLHLLLILIFFSAAAQSFVHRDVVLRSNPEAIVLMEKWDEVDRDIFWNTLTQKSPLDVRAEYPEFSVALIRSLQAEARKAD